MWKVQRQRTLAEEEEEVGRVVKGSTGKDASPLVPRLLLSSAAFLCRSSPACAAGNTQETPLEAPCYSESGPLTLGIGVTVDLRRVSQGLTGPYIHEQRCGSLGLFSLGILRKEVLGEEQVQYGVCVCFAASLETSSAYRLSLPSLAP